MEMKASHRFFGGLWCLRHRLLTQSNTKDVSSKFFIEMEESCGKSWTSLKAKNCAGKLKQALFISDPDRLYYNTLRSDSSSQSFNKHIGLCKDVSFHQPSCRNQTSGSQCHSFRHQKRFIHLSRRLSNSDQDTNNENSVLELLSRTRKLIKNPNWTQITVDFVFQNAGPDVISIGKDFLFSFVDSHIKDAHLELECLVLLLMASMTDQTAGHVVPGNQQALSPDTHGPLIVPTTSHLDYTLLFILTRIALDIHFQVKDTTRVFHNPDMDSSTPKINVLDKLQILIGDILITSIIRKISEMQNPALMKVIFFAISETVNQMMIQISLGTNESNEHPDASNGETSGNRTGTMIGLETMGEESGDFTFHFPRNELGACCEGILLTSGGKSGLQHSAREFGHLLAKAMFERKSSKAAEAESHLDKALGHLSSFPDCASKRHLASISRDLFSSHV